VLCGGDQYKLSTKGFVNPVISMLSKRGSQVPVGYLLMSGKMNIQLYLNNTEWYSHQ